MESLHDSYHGICSKYFVDSTNDGDSGKAVIVEIVKWNVVIVDFEAISEDQKCSNSTNRLVRTQSLILGPNPEMRFSEKVSDQNSQCPIWRVHSKQSDDVMISDFESTKFPEAS